MKSEVELQLIEEANYKVDARLLEKAATHCYSHLMKCCQKPEEMSNSWINTIKNGYDDLCSISKSHWNKALQEDPNLEDKIRKAAIEEYIKDKNSNAEIAYTVVKNTFNSLNDLKDISKLRLFLIAKATNAGNDEMVENIRKLFK